MQVFPGLVLERRPSNRSRCQPFEHHTCAGRQLQPRRTRAACRSWSVAGRMRPCCSAPSSGLREMEHPLLIRHTRPVGVVNNSPRELILEPRVIGVCRQVTPAGRHRALGIDLG